MAFPAICTRFWMALKRKQASPSRIVMPDEIRHPVKEVLHGAALLNWHQIQNDESDLQAKHTNN
jgi:hypothetical protein